jgi:hypothetical protein
LKGVWPGRFLPALRRSWRLRGGIGAASGWAPVGAGVIDCGARGVAAFGAVPRGFETACAVPADAADFDVRDPGAADFTAAGAAAFEAPLAALGAAFEAAGARFAGDLGSESVIAAFRRPRD